MEGRVELILGLGSVARVGVLKTSGPVGKGETT
jgi:hypothetical protein